MTRIIPIISNKGGTGKTTVAVNLALELSKNAKVLFVDTDPQANATDILLSDDEPERTFVDIIKHGRIATMYETDYGVDIIPSKLDLEFGTIPDNTAPIREALMFAYNEYDFIIIDTAPSFTQLTKFILSLCTEYLIVARPDRLSYKGTVKVKDMAGAVPCLGVVLNFCEHYKSSQRNIAEFKEAAGDCFDANLHKYKAYEDSVNDYKLPLSKHYAGTKAATNFNNFIIEFTTKLLSNGNNRH